MTAPELECGSDHEDVPEMSGLESSLHGLRVSDTIDMHWQYLRLAPGDQVFSGRH
jgi:hypothetical protein